MAHDLRLRALLAFAALATAIGCVPEPHGRPTFLVDTEGAPAPGFVARLGRLLDVELQPSFVDVRSIRRNLMNGTISGAMRFECRLRLARGIVYMRSDVGTHWTDSAQGLASADLSVFINGCGGMEERPFAGHSFWFFRPRIVDQPNDVEIRTAAAAAANVVLRRLSLDLKRDPAKLSNLRTFGLAMGDRDVSTLCAFSAGLTPSWERMGLRSANEGWTVELIDPNGSAARAGVRLGDVFVNVNGTVPTMMNMATLRKRADASGSWNVVYVSPSGTRRTVSYAARDVRWYANHE